MSQQAANSTPSPVSLVGTLLDQDYEIVRHLGGGGMGQLYEARHLRLPRRVAIKVIRADLGHDPSLLARFHREAAVTSSLGSPHIVDVIDFKALPDGSPYMVMELLVGEDLGQRLRRRGKLPLGEVKHLLRQLAAGLGAAHLRGVLHRDMKPENIFLVHQAQEDFVKLLDFGLSKVLGAQSMTLSHSTLGTPAYMSPEQTRGDQELDPRADIYSVGVVLYQALTGRVPFTGENPFQVLTKIASEVPRPPRELNPEIPGAVSELLLRTLAKKRDERPATMEALWSEFEAATRETAEVERDPTVPVPSGELLVGLDPTSPAHPLAALAASDPPALESTASSRIARRRKWLMVAALALLCAAGDLYWALRDRAPIAARAIAASPVAAAPVPAPKPAAPTPTPAAAVPAAKPAEPAVAPNLGSAPKRVEPPKHTHPHDSAKPAEPAPKPAAASTPEVDPDPYE